MLQGRQIHGRGGYNASCERFAAERTTGEIFSCGERVYNRVGGFFIVGRIINPPTGDYVICKKSPPETFSRFNTIRYDRRV